MTLEDVSSLFPSKQFEIVLDNARQIKVGAYIRIRSIDDSTTIYIQQMPDKKDSSQAIVLNNLEARFATEHYAESWQEVQRTSYYAQVLNVTEDRLIIIAIYGMMEKVLNDPLEIAVTDKQTKTKSGIPLRNVDAVKQHLNSDYTLMIAGESYIVIGKHEYAKDRSFQLLNGSSSYTVKEFTRREMGVLEDNEDDEENPKLAGDMIWAINSGERPFTKTDNFAIELWKCSIQLSDETTVGKQRAATQAFLESGIDQYLKVWENYTEIEYDLVKKIKTRAGRLNYKKAEWESGTTYALTLSNPQMLADFVSCLDGLGNESKVDVTVTYVDRKGHTQTGTRSGTLLRPDQGAIIVKVRMDGSNAPTNDGFVELSDALAKVQHDRRSEAVTRIRNANSAKPDLAMLIGGEKAPTVVNGLSSNDKKRIPPLSASVLECFGGNTPTETQRTAISIALNTPDFAIIQGPPGTGKTTVINAIMRALAEKEKDPELAYGQNLLTAYQRDTTSHLAEKLRVYGLPTPTYRGGGGRKASGTSDDEEDEVVRDRAIDNWIEEKRKELQARNPDVASLEASDRLNGRLNLIKLHFNEETATIPQTLGAVESVLLAIEECEKAEENAYRANVEELRKKSTEELLASGNAFSLRAPLKLSMYRENLTELQREAKRRLDMEAHLMDRYYASRLPVSAAAMSDNGEQVAERILRRFSADRYPEQIHKLVNALTEAYKENPLRFDKIQSRKDLLMISVMGSNWYTTDVAFNTKFISLVDGLITYIDQEGSSDEQRILADYHNAFEIDNDDMMKEWLSDFMTVIAATHQKTVSSSVKAHKGIEKATKESSEMPVEFSNVLIDEAARSCPPDLLIPLACAKDRMILVGDQKQLPQFISEEVYEKIDGYSKTELDELVRTTMFERLIKQTEKLQDIDKISRFIQLDEQYRMPKTLGDIIAKHFYNGNLKSPLGNDANHTSSLPFISGMHLVWLDVTGGRQSSTQSGSLTRQSEVDAITKMLKRMIQEGESSEKYSYAIITFYSAQRDRFRQAIRSDPFLSDWNRRNRKIMVGTVDAFQGMEADIVFLSLVRSLPKYDRNRNLYGFVSNANRQCVALSRAKRCLIIAGDKEMVSGARKQDAEAAMPAIAEIYQLCRKEAIADACILKNRDITG